MKSTFVVVVDGGGTKSIVHVYDSSGEILYAKEGSFVNLSVDPVASVAHLQDLLDQTQAFLASTQWKALIVGIAGKHLNSSHGSIQEILTTRYQVPTSVMRDVDLAKHAYLQEDGIIAISGTGSIGFGRAQDQELTVGGWGHILGDEGSAYSIGLQAIKAMVTRYDQGQALTATDQLILNELSHLDVDSVKVSVYNEPKAKIASLAKVLSLTKHDPDVDHLFIKEAQAFAVTISLITTRLPFKGNIPVHLMGGMFEHNTLFRNAFKEALQTHNTSLTFISNSTPVTIGGWYVAQGDNNE